MSDFASLLKDFQAATRSSVSPAAVKATKRPRSASNDVSCPPRRDFQKPTVTIDFLCVGAQKAGTTWLYEMLRRIPQVGLPESKEVHFWDWNRRKGLGWYGKQFPRGNDLVLGEITPCYMALKKHHVQEIHDLFPKARIIFLARDLVDRAWSALTMDLRNQARGLRPGEFDEDYRQMDATKRNKLIRDSNPDNYNDEYFMSQLTSRTYTDRSDYAAGLSRFLEHFPKDQILVLNYQDISEHPKELLIRVLQHIGVVDVSTTIESLTTCDLERRVNTNIVQNQLIRPSLRRKMENYLRPMAIEFNQLLQTHWPEFTWRLDEYAPLVCREGSSEEAMTKKSAVIAGHPID
ncbi:sulfotransferase domain-containing protein [Fragilaria crotonensis]|nr:sulfotransferase domain-containing protein [Fragilaria crotonensis]